jgi:flagellin-like hook-associated protein FlgL
MQGKRQMAQISFVTGSSFFAFDEQASKANRFASSIKAQNGGQGVKARLDGASVTVDRMNAIAASGLAAKVQALASARSNAAEGASLLQIADEALSEIETRADQLETLATNAGLATLSTLERAQLNTEFQSLATEIDVIAANTEFGDTKVLQGNGLGGALSINYKVGTGNSNYKVGTGNSASDEIAVTINAASASDLSAALASADLLSVENATSALSAVASAQAALGEIQGVVAGKLQSFVSASENNSSMAGRYEQARGHQAAPAVVIDLAQVVAERISKEQGIDLNGGGVETMRKLVLELNSSLVETSAARSTSDGVDLTNSQTSESRKSADKAGGNGSLTTRDAV